MVYILELFLDLIQLLLRSHLLFSNLFDLLDLPLRFQRLCNEDARVDLTFRRTLVQNLLEILVPLQAVQTVLQQIQLNAKRLVLFYQLVVQPSKIPIGFHRSGEVTRQQFPINLVQILNHPIDHGDRMQETGCLFVGLILIFISMMCIGEIIQLFQIRLLCLHKTVYTLCLDTVQQRLGFVDVLFCGIELFPCLIHTHLVARRIGSCRSDHLLVF